ncbi:MAG: DUF983 domain-containing protein [Alphaproteobacteria bacterium]|nr:DUF983 domain-containing protein [Alphaproteobacteria bacterium]
MADRTPSIPLLHTALSCTCPRCGQGRLFQGFLAVAPTCGHCGLDLSAHDSGDGPAVFLIFILGAIAVPFAFWIQFSFDTSPWVPVAIAGLLVIGLGLLLLRPAKALMVALQYAHRRDEMETRE